MTDAAMPESAPGRRDTVLVVDDTPETLGFLTDALDQAGLTVLVATDGESALALLEQVTPDLVLMDAVMPGLDGFETCRRLKRDKALAHLPVIFMTGLSETEHVVRGLQAGGVDYVTKPIVVDELMARIRVHLANARVAYGAQVALDTTGRYLLATDARGRLRWCTPQAQRLLAAFFPDAGVADALPAAVAERMAHLRRDGTPNQSILIDGQDTRRLEVAYLSQTEPDEFLFRISETGAGRAERALQQALNLTAREAEVLVWIAHGKSNRDISDILGISPRTVNKHLEQIFVKLGVENRASAAAVAVRVMAG
ncbi:response regulator transcription factor [Nitrospirillum iridis]|uniref:DNA-binding response OmpR family regulator/DNA-binding CsgD family transcriptional regulator n=1 Tax=Nitrospirillum iridis TaxID=765888 RepID=A0A7X0ED95_9PROT|nr:response regulator transcription factor [Nitrospirillum iridis]MBB6251895.1 DNA-binding response OmpR family regulator/DNA-binding CsgD family transcriptional regulator [Nitrospirillum iridis]